MHHSRKHPDHSLKPIDQVRNTVNVREVVCSVEINKRIVVNADKWRTEVVCSMEINKRIAVNADKWRTEV